MNDLHMLTLNDALQLAQSNDTPLDVLEHLAQRKHASIRRAIALNPSASKDLLLKLSHHFPEEVVQNPMFGLLALEKPNSSFVRISLARSHNTHPSVLENLSTIRDEELLILVGKNPNTPTHVLERMVQAPPKIRKDRQYRILCAIAQNTNISISLLSQLSAQSNLSSIVHCEIVNNHKTPIHILASYSTSIYESRQLQLANNPLLPTSAVTNLALSNSKRTRLLIKKHPNAPANLKSLDNFIKERPGTTVELLDQLGEDPRAYIRYLVARHPKTSHSALTRLAAREKIDSYYRKDSFYERIVNPHALSSVLEKCAEEWSKPLNMKADIRVAIGALIARHPNVSARALTLIASGQFHLRGIIAFNPKTPAAVLLAISKFPDTKYPLIHNPSTPAAALENIFAAVCEIYDPLKEFHKKLFVPKFSNHQIYKPKMLTFLQDMIHHPNVPDTILYSLQEHPKLKNALSQSKAGLTALNSQINTPTHKPTSC